MKEETKLNPCPKCNGEIKLYSSLGVGAVAICEQCKLEFIVCGMEELKVYNGCRIRKSTVKKIEKMWNKQTDHPTEKGGVE